MTYELRKAAEMALEALETFKLAQNPIIPQAKEALRQALSQPEQPEQPQTLLTFSEVQATITMSRSFVYKEIAAGRINPIKIGKSTRFVKSEIDKWLLSQVAAR